ncbi:unnamed protein product [Spirodela intermedia]|uniref:Protein kinase domain-containing protein n=1 Tax=Spirodela intermedia TaxID=51605 RepID=A0A7I8LF01_SPIIN|nr:unnamed protein product [Spirodela intermedia]
MAAVGEDGCVSWVRRAGFSSPVYRRLHNSGNPPVPFSGEPSHRLCPSPAGGDGGVMQAGREGEDRPHRLKEKARPWTRFFSYLMRKRRVHSVESLEEREETRGPPRLYVGSRVSGGSLGGCDDFGVLYRGIYGDRPVAVKVITLPADGLLRVTLKIRFIRETHFLTRLNHPNVIKMVAAGEILLDSWYIATEYCHAGGSLRDLLCRSWNRPLDLRKLIAIALNIARGMAHVHAEGIVHRNLTPENILVVDEESSCMTIIDGFGGACEEGRSEPVDRSKWNAPEMIKREPYDRKVDVYSFGLLLWEMQTGMVPFKSMTMDQVVSDVVLQEMRPAVPAKCVSALEWLIENCWAASPEERPQFSQIQNILERLQVAVTIAYEEG